MYTLGEMMFMNLVSRLDDVSVEQTNHYLNIKADGEKIVECKIQKESIRCIVKKKYEPIETILYNKGIMFRDVPQTYGWGNCVEFHIRQDNFLEAMRAIRILREIVR